MTIIIEGKKYSFDEAVALASEPIRQSTKSKKAWNDYIKKTKGKKCKAGYSHYENDCYEDAKRKKLCRVPGCGEEVGFEGWYCLSCKKDFCDDHFKNHERFNGRKFKSDD
jgi:hypothetical protein